MVTVIGNAVIQQPVMKR